MTITDQDNRQLLEGGIRELEFLLAFEQKAYGGSERQFNVIEVSDIEARLEELKSKRE